MSNSKIINTSKSARVAELNKQLLALSDWAKKRACGEHDESTTVILLERRIVKLKRSVYAAGQKAVERLMDQHETLN